MPAPDELEADPRFPWTRGLEPKTLGPRQPEAVRAGDEGDCPICARPDDDYLWTNEQWRLLPFTGIPLRGCVILESRRHADSFVDLADDEVSALGPVIARIERAVLSLGDVARLHVARWGEGIAHFHLWMMPRPQGVLEMRGPALMAWMDALEPLEPGVIAEAHALIREAMTRG